MSCLIKFSILSYYPSLLTGENINIGVALQSSDLTNTEFCHIRKWSRVEHYDDELDMDIFKLTILGIKEKLTTSLLNDSPFELDNFTKFFVNELKFSPVQNFIADSWESGVECIKKVHLRYDYDHHERLNDNQTKIYLKKLLKRDTENFSQAPIVGDYNERIGFDFNINNKQLIKLFKISDKNVGKLLYHVKSWAWTNLELSDKYEIFYVIIDDDITDKDRIKNIKKILEKSHANVLFYEDFVSNYSNYITTKQYLF